ncbi:hypothetical protein E4U41_005145, partial [Claviceps citrina]
MSRLLHLLTALLAMASLAMATSGSSERLMARLAREYKARTHEKLEEAGGESSCRPDNVAVRKEWGKLSHRHRREYIAAVHCLARLPSRIGADKAPGARSRFDDFQAVHIRQATVIHATGQFFAWHRHFVHLYETALRDECGYTGRQPYWDWPKYADRPVDANPLYDGSDTSMSGNGRYVPGRNGT